MLPLLSLDTEFAFASAAERARFANALSKAITNVVAEHTTACDARPAGGRRFRLVVGCYPTCK